MSKEFEILSDALDEAIADAQSAKPFLPRDTMSVSIEPPQTFSANKIKEIRHSTGLTQNLFAEWFGVSVRTIEAWEAGRNHPSGPSCRLLALLAGKKLSITG